MKREIKFRVWDVDMMYEGHFSDYFIDANGRGVYELVHGELERKEDAVPMQFTGLKDKNGIEIYEGDIISCQDVERAEIRYSSDSACFMMGIEPDWSEYLHWADTDKIEVIGNIYQHPHLLTPSQVNEEVK